MSAIPVSSVQQIYLSEQYHVWRAPMYYRIQKMGPVHSVWLKLRSRDTGEASPLCFFKLRLLKAHTSTSIATMRKENSNEVIVFTSLSFAPGGLSPAVGCVQGLEAPSVFVVETHDFLPTATVKAFSNVPSVLACCRSLHVMRHRPIWLVVFLLPGMIRGSCDTLFLLLLCNLLF